MSKTVATCIAETNLVQGEPQENVFFLTLSRKMEDFPNEFLRTARSTSPIQICAIFSTIGPDNYSAVLNLELNEELERIVASCANQAVLDFDSFANQVINNLNVRVCNFAANKGTQFKTSMSMFVIEGDILRVIHIGITKAVLFRNNRIMLLTEEQTVAHRYVQMGAIQAAEELTHPENMNLTQYLGKMPQDGPVIADKKVHLKLQDNDELFLLGVGLSRKLPSQIRNSIIAKPLSTEVKSKEIINAALSYGLKAGLTLVDIKVESTFLLPGDAVINSNLKTEATVAARPANAASSKRSNAFTDFEQGGASTDTKNYVPGSDPVSDDYDDEEEPIVNEKKERIKTIIIPIVIFIVCVVLGFGLTFMYFNMKDLISFSETTTVLPNTAGSVLYAASDGTPVYSKPSLDATIIGTLNRGDVVTLQEITDNTFSKVVTTNNVTGFVLSAQLLQNDPTYNDETSEMTGDPTPVPTEDTEETTSITTTAVQSDSFWGRGRSNTPTPTPVPTPVEPDENQISPTPDPNNQGGNGGNEGGNTPASPTPDPNNQGGNCGNEGGNEGGNGGNEGGNSGNEGGNEGGNGGGNEGGNSGNEGGNGGGNEGGNVNAEGGNGDGN